MAEVAARKRARSSSPVCDALASPLEVLLKRRRRDMSRTSSAAVLPPTQPVFEPPPPPPHSDSFMPSSLPASSSPGLEDFAQDADGLPLRGIERRRTRNWERLNAPSQPLAGPSNLADQPDSSPVARRRSPQARHLVSSSPVRHQPPPAVFREEWSAEERAREWGDEYASQNSMLHSLHLARLESHHSLTSLQSYDAPTPGFFDMATPAESPAPPPPHHQTPASVNPWRTQATPGFTPGGGTSSEYVSSPLFSPPQVPHATPSREVRASYEETNRLLAELNFARLRRHENSGGMGVPSSPSPPPGPSTDSAMDEQW